MPFAAQLLDLLQVLGDRPLLHTGEAAAPVRRIEQHDLDPSNAGSGDGRARLRESEVVELPDGCVARVAHLCIRGRVQLAHGRRTLPFRLGEHQLAPGPEVAASRAAAERALERVAVRVDESGQRH
jgi:hypothetical protein